MPLVDDNEEKKKIIKEAIEEWLNAQFAVFGRWSFYGLLSLVISGAAYFAFITIHGGGK